MQRVIPLRIADDPDLRATVESYRITQQQASTIAFESGCPRSAIKLHQLAYRRIKGNLRSQLTCTAIRSVSSEYARLRRRKKTIHSPVNFSRARALFLIGKAKRDACPPRKNTIRVWTVAGRKDIPYTIPDRFKNIIRDVETFDALSVAIKRGRLVATLSITVASPKKGGKFPTGVAVGPSGDIAVVDSENRSLQIITTGYKTMEETTRKTVKRLRRKLEARKADGRETRSIRRVLKRLSRKRHLRTKLFCHSAAKRIIEWAGKDAALVIEDLRAKPPSKQGKKARSRRPHFYGSLRRRIEEKAEAAGLQCFYMSGHDHRNRCSTCGAKGTTRRRLFRCGACGNESPTIKNAATNVRNKFTATRPWAAVNQP